MEICLRFVLYFVFLIYFFLYIYRPIYIGFLNHQIFVLVSALKIFYQSGSSLHASSTLHGGWGWCRRSGKQVWWSLSLRRGTRRCVPITEVSHYSAFLGKSTPRCWKGGSKLSKPQIEEEQWGFSPDCGTTDHLFTFAGILEGAWELNLPVCICFMDLEKVYDWVPRDVLWEELRGYRSMTWRLHHCFLQMMWSCWHHRLYIYSAHWISCSWVWSSRDEDQHL